MVNLWRLERLVEKDQLYTDLYVRFPAEFKTSSLVFNELAITVVARVSPICSQFEYKCSSRLNEVLKVAFYTQNGKKFCNVISITVSLRHLLCTVLQTLCIYLFKRFIKAFVCFHLKKLYYYVISSPFCPL